MRASELEIGKKYYTNSYTGIIVVTLLEIIDEDTALVKTKKSEPFKKSIKWLWETEDIAKMAGVGTGTIARYNRVMNSGDNRIKYPVTNF